MASKIYYWDPVVEIVHFVFISLKNGFTHLSLQSAESNGDKHSIHYPPLYFTQKSVFSSPMTLFSYGSVGSQQTYGSAKRT